jgi:hypothetical protein
MKRPDSSARVVECLLDEAERDRIDLDARRSPHLIIDAQIVFEHFGGIDAAAIQRDANAAAGVGIEETVVEEQSHLVGSIAGGRVAASIGRAQLASMLPVLRAEDQMTLTKSQYGWLAGLAGAAFATWWWRRGERSRDARASLAGRGETIFSNSPVTN